jgi:hypothetical protein
MSRRNMMQCIINPQRWIREPVLPLTEARITISVRRKKCEGENTISNGYPCRTCLIASGITISGILAG